MKSIFKTYLKVVKWTTVVATLWMLSYSTSFASQDPISAVAVIPLAAKTTLNVPVTTRYVLTNNLPFSVKNLNIRTQGSGGIFNQISTVCTRTLAPGQQCTWTGRFIPTRAGEDDAELILSYAGSSVPFIQQTIASEGHKLGHFEFRQNGTELYPFHIKALTVRYENYL